MFELVGWRISLYVPLFFFKSETKKREGKKSGDKKMIFDKNRLPNNTTGCFPLRNAKRLNVSDMKDTTTSIQLK
jgi:hypothetical protein